ncbi:hydroxymethylbilane synthase [Sphingomicrobium astaxanthinifaciens]|uniref:hydroxymethylbilane synthase n=1 Tax=Sphingomicrobium astaxanthinifaciens TaxID=1227949 RepID=UPI001FCA5903|nr:hydroxymethylbilane synthase [Sphingomicrobium astaxanthinifaciens]MCJ7421218.1 hydroxymethylbilane synthase [Sphingomicrobium astaxanthinifaciens]
MKFRLGTRGSPLALHQAEMVRAALVAAHGWDEDEVAIVTISTRGDRDRVAPLTEMGGKAVWTKELDRALLAGETDASVHSMKDVESDPHRPAGLGIAAMLRRADVRDRLVGAPSIEALPRGAVIGTASPRRAAQVRRLRPDLSTTLLRGNVATRLAAVREGKVDATLLAAAGLDRLGIEEGTAVAVATMLPAPAQGAIGIDARTHDEAAREALAAVDHRDTSDAVRLERAFTAALGGDCHSPVAAHAELAGDDVTFHAALYAEDGGEAVTRTITLDRHDTAGAAALARAMLDAAPGSIARLFA